MTLLGWALRAAALSGAANACLLAAGWWNLTGRAAEAISPE